MDKNKVYEPQKIEAKWQSRWESDKTFTPSVQTANKPYFNLMMFPYPSAEGLHVGNMYAFTGADVHGRFKRMHGNQVFEPIGLDGFGIHSENYAMKVGRHPAEQAKISQKNFYRQLRSTGNAYDWTRTLETYDPDYYKWTQWLFIQMFKQGLAYRKKATVNWCPSDKTVLADEQVIDGKCERDGAIVEKRELEQWFFKITDYADRLLLGLNNIDWPEKVKIAQRNWIGKSEGARVKFKIDGREDALEVFTTRPDTLYGATFMVVSPEHPIVKTVEQDAVQAYVDSAKKKSEQDRTAADKEKTGVDSGLLAINPVNGEKIPVWIADYVLMSYGTGAIMAVPAHDQRDFEFATKYNLPIKQVVMPCADDSDNPPKEGLKEVVRDTVIVHLRDKSTGKYAILDWHGSLEGITTAIMGGIEEGQTPEDAALMEIKEEAGLENVKIVGKTPWVTAARYCASHKNENRKAIAWGLLAEVESLDGQKEIDDAEQKIHTLVWVDADRVESHLTPAHQKLVWNLLSSPTESLTGEGELINSDTWNGLSYPADMEKILESLAEREIGAREANYHLRDWLISRQRYWGPPIPMIYCENCSSASRGEREDMPGWWTVPEEQLPVLLPEVEDWRPEGEGTSPLANHPEYYDVKCPDCGEKARRETDVSDTFLDSAWYYLRYLTIGSENATKTPYDIDIIKKWCPVAIYIGGAEHSVLHLLYVRFVAMVLHDLKDELSLPFEEPFPRFFAHGLIVKDGAKMSKSKGNVVVPDKYIEKFGADTLRMYLMFLGQFKDGGDFRDSGIEGMYRFVKRAWNLFNFKEFSQDSDETLQMINKTVKEVGEDLEKFSYNTAIAKLMEFYNFISEETSSWSKETATSYLKMLAPFAPHMTEELFEELKLGDGSIHFSEWPTFDEKYLVKNEVIIPIQVNGKRRGEVTVSSFDISQEIVETKARALISSHIEGNEVKKVIYVEGKIINFVI